METIADFENRKTISKLESSLKSANKKNDELRVKYNDAYHSNYSARKQIETLKRHKQSVLKSVLILIEDGLLTMSDKKIQERYFVDIGNIKNTRSIIRRERK